MTARTSAENETQEKVIQHIRTEGCQHSIFIDPCQKEQLVLAAISFRSTTVIIAHCCNIKTSTTVLGRK